MRFDYRLKGRQCPLISGLLRGERPRVGRGLRGVSRTQLIWVEGWHSGEWDGSGVSPTVWAWGLRGLTCGNPNSWGCA
eukprot:1173027-Pyramimonas_sp.AAC.1